MAGHIRESPERFDPTDDAGTLMGTEHLARYQWAAQVARGARVLDAGCGSGYGTAILAAAEPASLIAVDVADEAVELTRAALGEGADVRVADVRELPVADDAVDLVVCFELIDSRAETQADLEDTRAEVRHHKMLHERADAVVADMQGSPSWKLTKPLRAFKKLLRS